MRNGTSLNDADLWGFTGRVPWESIIDEDPFPDENPFAPPMDECIEHCNGDRKAAKLFYWQHRLRSYSRHNYVRCFDRTKSTQTTEAAPL